jgi:DNA-binding response OmpR family regulator
MATILLIGSDREYQENLASKLRTRGHAVLMADNLRLSSTDGNDRMSSVEIVVFDVTHFNEDGKRQLRTICQQPRQDGFPVLVLCYSKVYRGPLFELDIERIGARFVYPR